MNKIYDEENKKVAIMEMTNRQFQGIIRLTIDKIKRALKETPDNKELQELLEIYQVMVEDGIN